nr:MAG TPA: hypothetical protein [Caudoviricetes sp.]
MCPHECPHENIGNGKPLILLAPLPLYSSTAPPTL